VNALELNESAWRDRALVDFPFFARKMKIRIKSDISTEGEAEGRLGDFIWNEAQWIVWFWMCEQMARGLPIRLIILKARQFGISTFFCCWLFWWMWRKTQVRTLIATQNKGTTLNAMMETMDRFYQSLPEGFRPSLRAKGADRISKDELYFDDRKSACIPVGADVKDAGRGDAFDLALCTEVAAYKAAKEFFGAFTPAMGRRADTSLVMESTAQPGWFWDKYKSGKRFKQSVFLPWSVCKSLYSRKLIAASKGQRRIWRDAQTDEQFTLTAADKKEMEFLSRQHRIINEQIGRELLGPVTAEQMAWWHYTCESEYDGDDEWMNQEFPRDDISAFERSVRGVFKSVLPVVRASVEATLTDPAFDGAVVGATISCDTVADVTRESHRIEVTEDDDVNFTDRPGLIIFKMPVGSYVYTLGVDVADEMGTAADEDDAAFSVICVFCCNTREQVAEWRGSIDPHDLGDVIAMLGYLYNTGLANVEYNNMGITTIDRLTKYLEYPNRFRWPKFDEAGKLTKKEMWWTDEKTKQLAIGSLRHAIRHGLFIVRSQGLQEELTAYQVKRGHFTAGPDSYADRIMAAALAWQAVEQTDYGMAQVLGGADDPSDNAVGQARRVVEAAVKNELVIPPRKLPDEFDGSTGDTQDIEDPWEAAMEYIR
jgi:hypothetical protein